MTQVEKIVFAAAFAAVAVDTRTDDHHRRADDALRAAFDAVDLLRAAPKLAEQAGVMYEKEKLEYDAALERGERARSIRYRATPMSVLGMYAEFMKEG